MEKIWIFPNKEKNKGLIESLLEGRGVAGSEEIEEFLSPNPRLTFDPFLMKDMGEAVERILAALDKGEKICIYGDYDADGVCGVSLLMDVFRKLGADYTYYIPSRFDEGYGLNLEAMEKIKEMGTGLIITVDCGSSSYEEVMLAGELGMDIIVTDHHNLNSRSAPCLLINPKQEDCPYPGKDLSGCGVAFKLAQAMSRKKPDMLTKSDLNSVLDLVAIATVGDIVSLTGENRTMVKYGIKTIKGKKRHGLAHLIGQVGLRSGELKSEFLAYIIVPHLNAAGRMISAKTGIKLLTSDNEEQWKDAANQLIVSNAERKRLQNMAYEEAVKEINRFYEGEKFIVLKLVDAHEGITGIVAGKLKDKYNCPVIIVTPTGKDKLKGTGRSIEGINLYNILAHNDFLFEKFGGHQGACGFTMDSGNLEALRKALKAFAEDLYEKEPSIFTPKLVIHGEVLPVEVDMSLVSDILKLEPFGHKNPRPVLAMRKVPISRPFYMGDINQHVRFEAGGLQCVFFNGSERFNKVFIPEAPMDIAGFPEINRWNGNEKIQFLVEDLRQWSEHL
jgi:single-stranded-DNA-specific exonuclease